MGNRATVVFTDGKGNYSCAVYLHWNGGAESIYSFIEELDRRKIRTDQDYECARFIQIVGEFFDQDKIGGLSLGVANGPKTDSLKDLNNIPTDHNDNGLYLVNRTTNPLTMRRFTEDYENCPKNKDGHCNYDRLSFREWSEIEVHNEKKETENHKYREQFKTFYAKNGKEVEAR
jgi:hypothetical protein